jgi:DNA polymerase (family 10)
MVRLEAAVPRRKETGEEGKVEKREVIDALEEIAVLLELAGENPFKTRAYHNAARALQTLDRDLAEIVAAGELGKIRGIGSGLADKITTLVTEGELPYLEELRQRVSPGLLDLLKVPGLGPKRVKEIHAAYGISSLGELEYAAQSRTLQELAGFGEKLQAKILEGIAVLKKNAERALLSRALREAVAVRQEIDALAAVERCEIAGSVRRRRETVKDVDIVAATDDPAGVMEHFVSLPLADAVISHGETKSSIRLMSGLQVDLRAVTDEQYPYTLHHFTGSKEHNIALRARAQSMGLKINEYGLWKGEKLVPCKNEAEFFAALGLDYVAPELREDQGEIEAAEEHGLPRLLELGDLKGMLHTHSTHSDGVHTIEQMALAARDLGYEYVAMTDHSQSARYANGIQPGEIEGYLDEIARLNKKLDGIRILTGTESDILADGSLDYPDEILDRFDYIVGSVHSQFNMSEEEMTGRVLRALENPYTDVLGHPTGRLLLAREPFAIDMSRVCEAAAELEVAIEINANPHRLDLDWREVKRFLARGGWTSINPDAHRVEGLTDMEYGVAIARKGWATPDRVMNVLSAEELIDLVRRRRQRRRQASPRGEGKTGVKSTRAARPAKAVRSRAKPGTGKNRRRS